MDKPDPEEPTKPKRHAAPNNITIREMEIDDLPAVFELGERLFTADRWPTLHRTWDQYEVVEMFASDGETCLVADDGSHVVGFALGTLIEKRRSAWTYGYLLWIGVEPGGGRRGVGSRLVRRMTDLFIEQGARMMLVDTDADNEDALSFFRAQGFGSESSHVYLQRNLSSHPGYIRRRRKSASSRRSRRAPSPKHAPPAASGVGATDNGNGETALEVSAAPAGLTTANDN